MLRGVLDEGTALRHCRNAVGLRGQEDESEDHCWEERRTVKIALVLSRALLIRSS